MSHHWGTFTFTIFTTNIYTQIHIIVLSPICCRDDNLHLRLVLEASCSASKPSQASDRPLCATVGKPSETLGKVAFLPLITGHMDRSRHFIAAKPHVSYSNTKCTQSAFLGKKERATQHSTP